MSSKLKPWLINYTCAGLGIIITYIPCFFIPLAVMYFNQDTLLGWNELLNNTLTTSPFWILSCSLIVFTAIAWFYIANAVRSLNPYQKKLLRETMNSGYKTPFTDETHSQGVFFHCNIANPTMYYLAYYIKLYWYLSSVLFITISITCGAATYLFDNILPTYVIVSLLLISVGNVGILSQIGRTDYWTQHDD